MKQLTYATMGILIGGIFGFLVSTGEINYVKKNQRESVFPIFAILLSICGGGVGLWLGNSIAEEQRKSEALGLNHINSSKYKDGRKWVYKSEWVNPKTNETFSLITFYDKSRDQTITTLNNNLEFNHQTKTGADAFISKTHFEALNIIKKKLKDSIS